MKYKTVCVAGLIVAQGIMVGCAYLPGWATDAINQSMGKNFPAGDNPEPPDEEMINPIEPRPEQGKDRIDPADVTWLGPNIGGWKIVEPLRVEIGASTITYDQTISASLAPNKDGLTANPWIIVRLEDGKLYGASHEWMRRGQKTKLKKSVAADHIKQSRFNSWSPKVGETYYFCVAGLSRLNDRNASVRTSIVPVMWK